MSGIGKTTLAEVVFQVIQNKFQESSFIENIKDISKDHNSDLCKLQQKILDDVLKEESIPVRSVKHGQTLLRTKLHDMNVLIVLDDVNHADQFMYLVGGCEWFGPGTRIIVTTTNKDLLNAHKVNEIFMCEELNGEDALSLFCHSAFGDGHPTRGYEKLSDDIVKYTGGLPIALTVYGSLLCGKEEKYWNEILKKVQKYPHKEVLGRLEVGYDRLDTDQKLTFMYIACFVKGRDIDLVKDILTDVGLYPECGIPDLLNKFLLTINFDDCVWMHDLLQQMCWEILRKESQQCNGKQIAIKYLKEVLDILSSQPEESRTIEIINLESHKVKVDDCIDDSSCFSKMRKLKFLRISNIHFPQGLSYLSNDLRILEWYGCSLKSLPSMFEPKHIFQLEMRAGQLETLWEKSFDLPNLRSIDLSFSRDLTKIPDLSSTPKLVKLSLKGCTKLKELHGSVLSHKRLEFVNLSGCTHLQNLGKSKMEMEALVTLILSGCSNLEYVPEFGDNMKCLEHLYVDGTNIKNLPESTGELYNLRKLDASETSIQAIPLSIHYLTKLRLLRAHRCELSSQGRGFLFSKMNVISGIRELDLSYCKLSVVPDCIGLLHRLVYLDLSGNNLVFLPANISLLSNLRMLCLNNCKRLQSLPKLSIVTKDSLNYGLQMRFNYIVSEKKVDVSKFHVASNYISPMVSCLNCPKVAENESGSHLAERILNSYLQVSLSLSQLCSVESPFAPICLLF
ncbi:disease resistance-like protein DSC1 [Bidens hawaiensis]|uniref:disease resistance-like protein DSC1 n=1 Tax=Bidens hawaiensis TaxID=980011 RepID=UPI00404AF873